MVGAGGHRVIRLDGMKICITCGNNEVSYYKLAEAARTLPPQQWGDLCWALDAELRKLLKARRRKKCRNKRTG